MKLKLGFGALRQLRGYLAEYIAACAFSQWMEEKYPELKELKEMGPFFPWNPNINIWIPPPRPVVRHPTSKWVLNELVMPELRPIKRILDKGGGYPDLVASVRLGEGKEEKYFIEVKSGDARLDERQKLSMVLAKEEGYIPVIVRVRSMDVKGNEFDVEITELAVRSS